jgi:ATP-dependent Clp protease ATP-binding subunit ClpX
MVPQKSSIKHPNHDMIQIDTKNILFICGGAFDGLERIIKSRIAPSKMGIGIKKEEELKVGNHFDKLDSHDLVKFGIIPELVGRLPLRVTLNPLTIDELVDIITEPKSAIFSQYEVLLSSVNVDLTITEPAKRRIAEIASEQKTGARGIRSVMEKILTGKIYETVRGESKQQIVMDLDLVNQYFPK